jgi:capsular exopolysaccharide synthesis family protein
MSQLQNINIHEESDFKKVINIIVKNYKYFVICIIISIGLAFIINYLTVPVYKVTSSILIKEESQSPRLEVNDFMNSNMFGTNQGIQNEFYILKSSPVIEQSVKNLDLSVEFFRKEKFQYFDSYNNVPFRVLYLPNHPQPINVRFNFIFSGSADFIITAETKKASFYNFSTNEITHQKENWSFQQAGKSGQLIETSDLAFIVEIDSTIVSPQKETFGYGFLFKDFRSVTTSYMHRVQFKLADRNATVIELSLNSESVEKGINLLNEIMDVYSQQNLDRKNHIASITIDYIEKQLEEISDSLNLTEDKMQRFRSSNQLLDISDQAANISTQYQNLQNQLAELTSRKRYYDHVADFLKSNDNSSNLFLPSSIGISDQLLNDLMSEFIQAQAQRSNLIENKQERNPLVQQLTIRIETIKKNIAENISAAQRTTNLAIDEMSARIGKIESEISRIPQTQRLLGVIERKYRLNDAIYNYMLEKRAEATITKAANLPDNVIVEPAKLASLTPVSPNIKMNYLIALFLGFAVPFGFVMIRSALNNKIERQDDIEQLTNAPVLGKILHNNYKTKNIMFEYPKSNIAESYRALRTNLDFYVRGGHKKVIMITSCLEGEGKSTTALNVAMSYAQLDRKTILLNFDLRKPEFYFNGQPKKMAGLSSYLSDKASLEEIINKSVHEKLDYILSGPVPPNPVELIALEKTEKLITQLRDNYDYIVLDTPPLGQVADAYLLINFAEVKVLVTRYNYSIKNVLSLIMRDLNQKKINSVCIVMNDNRINSDQYGYGYGYYSKRKGWGFLQRKKKRRSEKTNPTS